MNTIQGLRRTSSFPPICFFKGSTCNFVREVTVARMLLDSRADLDSRAAPKSVWILLCGAARAHAALWGTLPRLEKDSGDSPGKPVLPGDSFSMNFLVVLVFNLLLL